MNLLDLAPGQADQVVADWVADRGLPRYRAIQVFPRLWQRPVREWRDCSDLPKDLIELLDRDFPLMRPKQIKRLESSDGTVKYLWAMADGAAVESVVILEGNRRTLCISSQVGCAYKCSFCATGKMGFVRNLTPWEITAQVRELAVQIDPEGISNVVFMGMGEPLHNWPAVDVALTILNDQRGLGIGARRITVSTVGIVPILRKLAARPEQFRLALSVHSPFGDRRQQLMPVERRYPLEEILREVGDFSRRVTFEYVMIQGVNDRPADIDELAEKAHPIGALVNLLPLHPGGPSGLRPTPRTEIHRFASSLRGKGVNVTVRRSRGLDIAAACGQLWTDATRAGEIATEQHGNI
jgi:23S rRNA (adenine2503-C2)-methyltransferase